MRWMQRRRSLTWNVRSDLMQGRAGQNSLRAYGWRKSQCLAGGCIE